MVQARIVVAEIYFAYNILAMSLAFLILEVLEALAEGTVVDTVRFS
jgi:hypothetical protein